MWKVFLYNQWQYEKAEKYLCDMENNGFRLEKVKYAFFFKFRNCTPKKAKYIFLYNLPKDYTSQHYDCEKYIYSSCKGARICGRKNWESNVFRISDFNADLDPVYQFRDAYVKRALKQKMLISSFFVLPTILLYAFLGYSSDIRFLFLLSVSSLALLFFLYNAIGLLSMSKK